MDDLLSRKKAIRDAALAQRNDLTIADREARSAMICKRIEGIGEFRDASSILFFMPFRGEPDILPLMAGALARGALCALPRCADGRSLRLYAVSDPERDVEPGMWGIREPKECLSECTAAEFSVIMVPGAAFDRIGRRIGYGAGYYDRMLASAGIRALTIAPAYSFQVFDALPYGPLDMPVDIVAAEEEIIDCRRAGGDKYG